MSALLADVLAWLARLTCGATVRWVDGRPTPAQSIYFANHTSHLDFVVLWSVLPKERRRCTRPVAAREYWERGRVRRYLATRVFRAVLVERELGGVAQARDQLERMVEALDEGSSLILFPEGTRGAGPEMAPFRAGLYHLARRRPDVDLVPVHLRNLDRIMPKGEFLPVPMLGCVSFGRPLRLQDGESKAALLERAREAVERLAPP